MVTIYIALVALLIAVLKQDYRMQLIFKLPAHLGGNWQALDAG